MEIHRAAPVGMVLVATVAIGPPDGIERNGVTPTTRFRIKRPRTGGDNGGGESEVIAIERQVRVVPVERLRLFY